MIKKGFLPRLKNTYPVITQKEAERNLNLNARIRQLFANVWTIPNVLTMIRLILVPVFAIVFFRVNESPKITALVIFAAASLTDMLDGMLARKLNQITDFGKLFDPLADKLMVLTAMFCQAVDGVFPWSAIIIVAAKELYMVLGGIFMLSRNVVVYSNLIGKAAQVCFIISLILSFFHQSFLDGGAVLWGMTPDRILLWLTVGLAVLAMICYTADYLRKSRRKTPEDPED